VRYDQKPRPPRTYHAAAATVALIVSLVIAWGIFRAFIGHWM
jgi:hypothetical protein